MLLLGQKLGHKAKLKENLVNTVEAAYSATAAWTLVGMFMMFRPGLNKGHAGLKLGH